MADFLDVISRQKHAEIAELEPRRAELRRNAESAPAARNFAAALSQDHRSVSVIAEIKRQSPSQEGKRELDPTLVAKQYEAGGASAISVLTDGPFFAGGLDDLLNARRAAHLPVLRKDFVLNELQVFESRAMGADAVLLIATLPEMDGARLSMLRELVESLGMTALVEVHSHDELDMALGSGAGVIGVNRRNLASLEIGHETIVDDRADQLIDSIPGSLITVAMSGIASRGDVDYFGQHGFDAVLVGRHIVQAGSQEEAVRDLVGVERIDRS